MMAFNIGRFRFAITRYRRYERVIKATADVYLHHALPLLPSRNYRAIAPPIKQHNASKLQNQTYASTNFQRRFIKPADAISRRVGNNSHA